MPLRAQARLPFNAILLAQLSSLVSRLNSYPYQGASELRSLGSLRNLKSALSVFRFSFSAFRFPFFYPDTLSKRNPKVAKIA